MGRPKTTDYPDYMSDDGDVGGFVIRNPITKKKKRYSRDQEAEAREAAQLLGKWVDNERRKKLLDAGKPKVDDLIIGFKNDTLDHQPWDDSTRETFVMRLNRISRECGQMLAEDADRLFIRRWLNDAAKKADPFNKWLRAWTLICAWGVEEKLLKDNEAQKIQIRSTSRKIKSNRKERSQLDIEGYVAAHALAEPFLQIAMEGSLLTTLSRLEIASMKHAHFRDGYLFVIRDKVSADSDMAFIRIEVTPELEAWRKKAARSDGIISPFLVHRRPDRMQRRWIEHKEHWTQVDPDYITRAFSDVIDRIPRYAAMPKKHRPPFHEIRGLAGRQMQSLGMAVDDIRRLMTHADKKTTQIYLEKGIAGLTDEHFRKVRAPFTMKQLLAAE